MQRASKCYRNGHDCTVALLRNACVVKHLRAFTAVRLFSGFCATRKWFFGLTLMRVYIFNDVICLKTCFPEVPPLCIGSQSWSVGRTSWWMKRLNWDAWLV